MKFRPLNSSLLITKNSWKIQLVVNQKSIVHANQKYLQQAQKNQPAANHPDNSKHQCTYIFAILPLALPVYILHPYLSTSHYSEFVCFGAFNPKYFPHVANPFPQYPNTIIPCFEYFCMRIFAPNFLVYILHKLLFCKIFV